MSPEPGDGSQLPLCRCSLSWPYGLLSLSLDPGQAGAAAVSPSSGWASRSSFSSRPWAGPVRPRDGGQDPLIPPTPACLHPLPGVRVSIPKTELFSPLKKIYYRNPVLSLRALARVPTGFRRHHLSPQRDFSSPLWKDGFLSLTAQFLHLKNQCTVVFYGEELRGLGSSGQDTCGC